LHKGIDSTLNIISNEVKYHCTVFKEYGDIPEIVCLPSQLNQVFMNLLVNAAQSIETQGDIIIRTGRNDREVWVEISDSGKGIAPEHLTRLFEPFYTTKPVGKGTGLGLSISQNIVRKHGGRIEIDSKVGIGTTFRVWLPIRRE
jgi:signal transduction histidine kinase